MKLGTLQTYGEKITFSWHFSDKLAFPLARKVPPAGLSTVPHTPAPPAPPWRVPVSLSRQLHCDCSKIVPYSPLGTITRNAVPICFEQEIVAAGMPFKRVMGHNFFYIKMLVKSIQISERCFIYFAYTIAKNIINYNS